MVVCFGHIYSSNHPSVLHACLRLLISEESSFSRAHDTVQVVKEEWGLVLRILKDFVFPVFIVGTHFPGTEISWCGNEWSFLAIGTNWQPWATQEQHC